MRPAVFAEQTSAFACRAAPAFRLASAVIGRSLPSFGLRILQSLSRFVESPASAVPLGTPTGVLHSLKGGGRRAELSPSRFCSRLANRDMRLGASAGKTEPVEVAPVAGGGSGACDLRSRCRSALEGWAFFCKAPLAAARLFSSVRVPLGTRRLEFSPPSGPVRVPSDTSGPVGNRGRV